MPLSPASNEPEHVSQEPENSPENVPTNASSGVTPRDREPATWQRPAKIRTARFGELEEHELIRLLDTIEDERARSRFRESVYISVFVWMVVLWLMLYGPRYLWHAPRVANPMDVLKDRELTELSDPHLHAPRAPLPKPPLRMDNKTLENVRKMTPPAPPPPAPTPTPTSTAPTPTPTPPAPAPQPSHAASPIVDAPQPQPHVNFPSAPSPSNALSSAMHGPANPGGNYGPGAHAPGGANVGGGMEVLSDMQGVDFSAWLRRMHDDVLRNWEPLLPEETEAPILKQGETYLRVKINPDGSIGDMHLDGPSGDVAIDKSCWGSITSEGQFPPLPRQFHGPYLELRLHYMVNKHF
jgi:outer membrane biosynthesis protein TonB